MQFNQHDAVMRQTTLCVGIKHLSRAEEKIIS
jgi:hypothetical protein